MKDLSTMGVLRGAGIPLADSVGQPLGPARLGSVPIVGRRSPAPPLASRASAPSEKAMAGPAASLNEAQKALDKASVTAQQIQKTFTQLSDLIGEDAAATAAEQAADSLESASNQYQEAKRSTTGAD